MTASQREREMNSRIHMMVERGAEVLGEGKMARRMGYTFRQSMLCLVAASSGKKVLYTSNSTAETREVFRRCIDVTRIMGVVVDVSVTSQRILFPNDGFVQFRSIEGNFDGLYYDAISKDY